MDALKVLSSFAHFLAWLVIEIALQREAFAHIHHVDSKVVSEVCGSYRRGTVLHVIAYSLEFYDLAGLACRRRLKR